MSRHLLLSAAILALTVPAAMAQQGVPGGHFIENWDSDGDGGVTLTEAAEKRGELLTMFDMDENGELDASEYAMFDETREADIAENEGGGKGPMRRVSQGLTMPFNDVDRDGVVTRAEFLDQTSPWFAELDANADGRVTPEDFERFRQQGKQ